MKLNSQERDYQHQRALAFARSVDLPFDDGRQGPGVIALANDTRFAESYFNRPVTTYALGRWDKVVDINAELEFFAPPTQVPRRFTYAEFVNAEDFLSENVDDQRAIGGDFKRVEYTSKKTTGQTDNRGLTIRIDLDEIAEKVDWETVAVDRLIRRLKRNKLRRAIALLSAAATNTAKTWDTTAGKDPDQDVQTDLLAGAALVGLKPNCVGYGETAWDKRRISHRAQLSAGGFASSKMTPDEVGTSLMVDKVMVSRARFSSTATARTEIVSNLVLEFLGYDAGSIDDPSSIKGFWSPVDGGGPVRVFTQQVSAKLYDVTVEHYELTKMTSTLGVRKLTIS